MQAFSRGNIWGGAADLASTILTAYTMGKEAEQAEEKAAAAAQVHQSPGAILQQRVTFPSPENMSADQQFATDGIVRQAGAGFAKLGIAINVPERINQAEKQLSPHCNKVFSQKIPGYTKAAFFNKLSTATINQFPGATPPQLFGFFGADAVTLPPGGPIDLLPNFYGLDEAKQAFVLIHEGIHLFGRGRLGDVAVQRLFGIPVSGNTSNITDYIQGGCKH